MAIYVNPEGDLPINSQPDGPYLEGVVAIRRDVVCNNKECEKFEVPIDQEIQVSYVGNRAAYYYTCPTCGEDSLMSYELTEEETNLPNEEELS
jgi:hypothetical protein